MQISGCWEESAQGRVLLRNEILSFQGEGREHYGVGGRKTAHFGIQLPKIQENCVATVVVLNEQAGSEKMVQYKGKGGREVSMKTAQDRGKGGR